MLRTIPLLLGTAVLAMGLAGPSAAQDRVLRVNDAPFVAALTRLAVVNSEKDRKKKASIVMVAGVSVRSLSGSTSVREPIKQTNRCRCDAISSRRR